ncbi:uncharacterized protein MYCFIDRAFT_84359 [Pseudocercospora fijiensis CIRAD86]|uniref:Uncharacterized protein n=1 Tax=Pseudocercospora fijiensis (strain CIRAD86) TaxID=383855 RepID=M2ZEM4_PSEFD|nr:uncharacterized protein MYCFIDRAFT_84359 [Pseudocercospora fijiensis CIRAD86]EME77584.1 hypothetical protein MYCFIDRAFT_84359 [Pseudocercospora fijiensis CIRAD86]
MEPALHCLRRNGRYQDLSICLRPELFHHACVFEVAENHELFALKELARAKFKAVKETDSIGADVASTAENLYRTQEHELREGFVRTLHARRAELLGQSSEIREALFGIAGLMKRPGDRRPLGATSGQTKDGENSSGQSDLLLERTETTDDEDEATALQEPESSDDMDGEDEDVEDPLDMGGPEWQKRRHDLIQLLTRLGEATRNSLSKTIDRAGRRFPAAYSLVVKQLAKMQHRFDPTRNDMNMLLIAKLYLAIRVPTHREEIMSCGKGDVLPVDLPWHVLTKQEGPVETFVILLEEILETPKLCKQTKRKRTESPSERL